MDKYIALGEAKSIGVQGNVDVLALLIKLGRIPDIVTDQTSAHDDLNGYVPSELSYQDALSMRENDF